MHFVHTEVLFRALLFIYLFFMELFIFFSFFPMCGRQPHSVELISVIFGELVFKQRKIVLIIQILVADGIASGPEPGGVLVTFFFLKLAIF